MKAIKYLGLTLMLGACTSPQPKDYYEIVGEVKNVEDSTIINLVKWDGDTGRTISVDTIIDGKLNFLLRWHPRLSSSFAKLSGLILK